MVHTTTPNEISKRVAKLIERVSRGEPARYLPVSPEPDALANECFPNVMAKVSASGGSMLCGWQIWEWPHVLVEAEYHAVWRSPEGDLVEITPKPHGETRILFVPDARLVYDGYARDNVRMAIRDDVLVQDFIRTAEAVFKLMNRGERARMTGQVSVPADEFRALGLAKNFLAQSIEQGLKEHSPCLCGSGRKYRQCHSAQFQW